MATLLAGGGRRSAAPVYNTAPRSGTSVINSAQTLEQLMAALNAPATPDINTGSASFEETFEQEGQARDAAEMSWARDAALGLRGAGLGMQGYGQLTGDTEMSSLGGDVSQAGGYANALYGLANADSAGDVAKAGLPLALKRMAIPIPYAAMVTGAINNGPKGAVSGTAEAALSVAFPMFGIANAISGIFGGPTVGGLMRKFMGGDKPPPTEEQLSEALLGWFGGMEDTGESSLPAPDPNDYSTGGV